MPFSSVRLYQYRNLENSEIDTAASQVFLIGKNGQGKTNFLETIYLLCFGSSFRTKKDRLIIRNEEQEMSLLGKYENREIRFVIQNGKKTISLDGKTIKDRKELLSEFSCVLFCHEDLQFVTGEPAYQRQFFNQTLSLNNPAFIDIHRNYMRTLKSRNQLLKERRLDYISVYDEKLIEYGLEIVSRRAETVDEFNNTFTSLYKKISGLEDDLYIEYRPSWSKNALPADVDKQLNDQREKDILLKTTSSGPHRDRFAFRYKDSDFTDQGSMGQLRLISLILRTAQAVYFTEVTGKLPILLLDDVLLELDPEKRQRFIELLPKHQQAFYTFLPDENYSSYRKEHAILYEVKAGVLAKTPI